LQLTITGSGFQDTGSLYCFAECTITITKECMTLKVATFETTVSRTSSISYSLRFHYFTLTK